MKTLQSILLKNYTEFFDEKQLPSFSEGNIITAIMNNGYPVPCEPRTYHNIKCPMCGSDKGYRVFNYGEYWWACRNRECIRKNARRPENTQKKDDISELLPKIGITPRLIDASFESWKHPEEMKKFLIEYAHNPKEALTFTGTNGIGKSYCAVATIKEFYRYTREIPFFFNVSSLYQEWLSNVTSLTSLIYKLTRTPLLVLDDIGIKTPSDSFTDFLYLIVNSRYCDMKGTIVTTNLDADALVRNFGDAIVSRLFGGEVIHFKGRDKRIS